MSLAVAKYGNRYLGDREVKLSVSPYRTTFGRERWRAEVRVDGTRVRWSSSQDIGYWPSFTGRDREAALAKATRWVKDKRAASLREDGRLQLEKSLMIEVLLGEAPAPSLRVRDAYAAGLIAYDDLDAAVEDELAETARTKRAT